MVRIKLGLLAAALTAGAVVGCAQCDTCDDFPTPCLGGNCGPQPGHPGVAAGTYTLVTPDHGGPMMLPPGAPLPPGVPAGPATGAVAVPAPTSGTSAPAADAVPPPPPPRSEPVTPPPPDSAGNAPRPIL